MTMKQHKVAKIFVLKLSSLSIHSESMDTKVSLNPASEENHLFHIGVGQLSSYSLTVSASKGK